MTGNQSQCCHTRIQSTNCGERLVCADCESEFILKSTLAAARGAPVQGYAAGIPWSLHLRAWDAYAAKWGRGRSAERLAERGGFAVKELDEFVPGWRDEVSEITALRKELDLADAINVNNRMTYEVTERALEAVKTERDEYRKMIGRASPIQWSSLSPHPRARKSAEDWTQEAYALLQKYERLGCPTAGSAPKPEPTEANRG